MRNPKTSKEADELYRKLFVPKPCPCTDMLRPRDLMTEALDELNQKHLNQQKQKMNPFDFAYHGHCQDYPDCWNCRYCYFNSWIEFWLRVDAEWAEQQKKLLYYSEFNCGEECEEEEESCDYTGEECVGNKLFCEECEVLIGEDE